MANDNQGTQTAAAPAAGSTNVDGVRTLIFIGAAAACLAITGLFEWTSRPKPIEEFGKVGQEFYAEFTDPTTAAALEVYAFDVEKVQPLDFRVEKQDNGRWVIPSHHDYPTDAEDQLAKTASSIIGIKRGAMVTRWESDHAQYSVVNPKQDSLNVDDVEGVGKRIILRSDDKSVLADYIIGKQVENSPGQYYVRHPDEDEVYIAALEIDLSTKFTDWIKTDFLELNSFDITSVTINDYSFDELKGQITRGEIHKLFRKTSSDPWEFAGIDAEQEEVNTEAVSATVNALGDLKIAGVRPKQKGLTPELELDRQALKSQRDLDRLQSDLLTRGFLLRPAEGGNPDALQLVAREGELSAATSGGLVYKLHFGRAFTGSQEELEIGLTSQEGEDADDKEKQDDAKQDAPDEGDKKEGADEAAGGDEEESNESGNPGRYVFVRVEFDETLLEKPEKPVEPQPPALKESDPKESDPKESDPKESDAKEGDAKEGDAKEGDAKEGDAKEGDAKEGNAKESDPKEGDAKETDAKDGDGNECQDAGQDAQDPPADNKPATPADDKPKADSKDDMPPEVDPAAAAQKAYELAKIKYQTDVREYERKLSDYESKVEEGKKKAEELNRRFAAWYYVIPGDSYDKIKLSRSDLVKAKEVDPGQANQEAADKFLAENKDKEGVTTTASGLQYEVLKEGEGESPKPTSRVKVKYKGTLLDGSVFDESGDREVEFGVNQVIPGWTEALQLMKPGAKYKLYIPPNIAYGEQGSGEKIGPNSLLVFEVELISFE